MTATSRQHALSQMRNKFNNKPLNMFLQVCFFERAFLLVCLLVFVVTQSRIGIRRKDSFCTSNVPSGCYHFSFFVLQTSKEHVLARSYIIQSTCLKSKRKPSYLYSSFKHPKRNKHPYYLKSKKTEVDIILDIFEFITIYS